MRAKANRSTATSDSTSGFDTAGPSQTRQQQRQSRHNSPVLHPEGGARDHPPSYSELPTRSVSTSNNAPTTSPLFNAQQARTLLHSVSTSPSLPPVDILAYLPSSSAALSDDNTTVTITDSKLCTDPDLLAQFITRQAALPPRPQVRITGYIEQQRPADFDIRIDMMRYFIRPVGSTAWNYTKLVDNGEIAFRGETAASTKPHENSTQEWAKRFCRSPVTNKVFVMERVPVNWNIGLLEGRIRNLLASLHYAGKVEIGFGASHTHVVVQPPQSGLLPRFLKVLTASKKYAVIRSIWPYANVHGDDRSGCRESAVQNEDDWWELWRGVIALAIISRRKGWVTSEDVLDMAMCLKNEHSVVAMDLAS